MIMPSKTACLVIVATATAAFSAGAANAASEGYNRVPELDVKSSCNDAQKFSSGGGSQDSAFKGCMQDEMTAKDQLAKRWSAFKVKDKQTCVEQARAPSPSYVEVLTCLEMDTDAVNSGGNPSTQIGGPLAPGLSKQNTPPKP